MIEIGTQFKASDKMVAIGKYKCVVCGLIIDIEQKFVDMGHTFFSCPICHAGTEGWPKGPEDDVREYLG